LPAGLDEWIDRWRPPISHAASLALLTKPVFAVNTWATPSQQPIAVTPAWEPLYRYHEQNPNARRQHRRAAALPRPFERR